MHRRSFLGWAGLGGMVLRRSAANTEHPVPVKSPRATSGDPVEPDWAQRLTYTVGPGKADLMDHRKSD